LVEIFIFPPSSFISLSSFLILAKNSSLFDLIKSLIYFENLSFSQDFKKILTEMGLKVG